MGDLKWALWRGREIVAQVVRAVISAVIAAVIWVVIEYRVQPGDLMTKIAVIVTSILATYLLLYIAFGRTGAPLPRLTHGGE